MNEKDLELLRVYLTDCGNLVELIRREPVYIDYMMKTNFDSLDKRYSNIWCEEGLIKCIRSIVKVFNEYLYIKRLYEVFEGICMGVSLTDEQEQNLYRRQNILLKLYGDYVKDLQRILKKLYYKYFDIDELDF
jgi:hypothetical protein